MTQELGNWIRLLILVATIFAAGWVALAQLNATVATAIEPAMKILEDHEARLRIIEKGD